MPTSDPVITEVKERVMVITINRPEAKNALDRSAATRVAAAIDELEARTDLSVGVLTGAGGTFCAGMDLKAFVRGEGSPSIPGRGFAGITEQPPTKPLIAAVEGWALAGGCELALATDIVVASASAKFGLPEVKRGLVAAAGGLLRLPKAASYSRAMLMAVDRRAGDGCGSRTLRPCNRIDRAGTCALNGVRHRRKHCRERAACCSGDQENHCHRNQTGLIRLPSNGNARSPNL